MLHIQIVRIAMSKWGERLAKVCPMCKIEFFVRLNPKESKKIFCSVKCRIESAITLPMATCKWCDEAFQPKFADRTAYCSNRCKVSYKAIVKVGKAGHVPIHSSISFAICPICNKWFRQTNAGHKVCGSNCHNVKSLALYRENKDVILSRMRDAYVRVPESDTRCVVCGTTFKTNRRKTCSVKCLKKLSDHGKPRKRARKHGVDYEPVVVVSVFNRDGWTCQICGVKTPSAAKGKNKPNSPELDHRVPISKGGGHTYDNVQCACRKCNGAKGNRNEAGQMPLFSHAV